MRKDRGLSLPMLTWIMFLKFLDDMKRVREEDVMLEGKRFRPHRAALPLARGFPLSRE